eukprot:358923-Chlamydomonas_euryale.AAC.3
MCTTRRPGGTSRCAVHAVACTQRSCAEAALLRDRSQATELAGLAYRTARRAPAAAVSPNAASRVAATIASPNADRRTALAANGGQPPDVSARFRFRFRLVPQLSWIYSADVELQQYRDALRHVAWDAIGYVEASQQQRALGAEGRSMRRSSSACWGPRCGAGRDRGAEGGAAGQRAKETAHTAAAGRGHGSHSKRVWEHGGRCGRMVEGCGSTAGGCGSTAGGCGSTAGGCGRTAGGCGSTAGGRGSTAGGEGGGEVRSRIPTPVPMLAPRPHHTL